MESYDLDQVVRYMDTYADIARKATKLEETHPILRPRIARELKLMIQSFEADIPKEIKLKLLGYDAFIRDIPKRCIEEILIGEKPGITGDIWSIPHVSQEEIEERLTAEGFRSKDSK